MLIQSRYGLSADDYDVCVVGAGPLGIAAALECARAGYEVLLIESGTLNRGHNEPIAGDRITNPHHSAPELSRARGLGGTSQIWGGRCTPMDPADFKKNPSLPDLEWPIPYQELAAYHERAAAFFGIDAAMFQIALPGFFNPDFELDKIEVWLSEANIGRLYRNSLAECPNIKLLADVTVTSLEVDLEGNQLSRLRLRHQTEELTVRARRTILACGGIDTTRLLLAAQAQNTTLFGGKDGPLGRYYMGHLTGVIADLVLTSPQQISDLDFFKHGGVYIRRRITLREDLREAHCIGNIAFWTENPPLHNPEHRSGFLSLLWLLLYSPVIGERLIPAPYRKKMLGPPPHQAWPHIANVLRSPGSAVTHTVLTAWYRYLSRAKKPSHLRRNSTGRYALCYHSEHLPDARSRMQLSSRRDGLDRQTLNLSLYFDLADSVSVLKAHRLLDRALRKAGIGKLEYRFPAEELRTQVLQQACDGRHQLGTTRLGSDPSTSVVDADGRIHDLKDTYVASSSVFVTSGAANPTFAGVAFALRVADKVIASLSEHPQKAAPSLTIAPAQR